MMRLFFHAAWISGVCAIGCGDSAGTGSGTSAGGGGTGGGATTSSTGGGTTTGVGGASGDLLHSCDNPMGGARMCSEWAYPAEYAGLFDGAQMDCEEDGGTFGETCDATGAVGGCRTTDTGAPGITVTTWVYTGTVSDVMAYCTSLTATFVDPP